MVDDITLSELNAKIRFKVKWIAQRGDRWGRHLTHKFTSRSLNDLTSKICQLKFHRTFLNVSSSSDVAPAPTRFDTNQHHRQLGCEMFY